MSQYWEDRFRTWSKPASATEAEKQANAERMVRDAVRGYEPLRAHDVKIIPQGSYRNNTNVRQESDVDLCVCCTDTFFYSLAFADYDKTVANVVDASYSYSQFKSDVEAALRAKFGARGVSRGDKALDVHENGYRVDADVVAAFEYRLYLKRSFNALLGAYTTPYVTPAGVKFYSDSGKEIINWPDQHYANGVSKNERTRGRFKSIVRVVKNLKYDMEQRGISAARPMGSYLIESLIFNVPDHMLDGDSYFKNVRDSIAVCFAATAPDGDCGKWFEVNGIKYLFHLSQPWTREQVNEFTLATWQYCGFS